VQAFIDIHGHSRKKSVFIYGPHFPLHNEKYIKMRVIPKLLSERTEMFRFYSCKFRIEKCKLKAARVVLWKQFSIMNCFTLEASFHGFLNNERVTEDLGPVQLEKMGGHLGESLFEYACLVEEDERAKEELRRLLKLKRKRKMKAKDLVNATKKASESSSSPKITLLARTGGFREAIHSAEETKEFKPKQQPKRTLKNIYKQLKMDVKKPEQLVEEDSSSSSDEGDMEEEELDAAEQKELQGAIIGALERFDQLYNKAKKKAPTTGGGGSDNEKRKKKASKITRQSTMKP